MCDSTILASQVYLIVDCLLELTVRNSTTSYRIKALLWRLCKYSIACQ